MDAHRELNVLLREAATLHAVGELLSWDQETMMPPGAAEFRAEERSLVSAEAHRRDTDPRIGELLARCEADPALTADPATAADLREIRRDYERAQKLPVDLVAELTQTSALAVEAWREAREKSDFASFRPWLDRLVDLQRRRAACLGTPPRGEPYDALLEDYEPGMTGAELERIFGGLRRELRPLIGELTSSGRGPKDAPLRLEAPNDVQHAFSQRLLEHLAFDKQAGRLDASTHPFSTGLGPGDTRITIRKKGESFLEAVGSTLHEAGHALYEQGLPKATLFGRPLSQPASLGIHESQSRLWENQVGRSRPFWSWALPQAIADGAPLSGLTVDDVHGAINVVRPGLIRVGADEATYNLHIMLRFDLERAMIRGDLRPADLPGAWNERIRADLGVDVPDDRRGCLQDIHWASGALGYFPTYTLGNLYAAQLWEAAASALPDLEQELARGAFAALLDWLRRNVHAHGRRFSAGELCRQATGQALDHAPLMRHLRTKLGTLYGIA
jgi:carboxypeptidase Taq